MIRRPPRSTLFPYTRSSDLNRELGPDGTIPDGLKLRAIAIATWRFVSEGDRKSTRLNSSHMSISYAVFCLKKKIKTKETNLVLIMQNKQDDTNDVASYTKLS